MREAVVVSTARTPIGRAFRGAFNKTHGAVLAALGHTRNRHAFGHGALHALPGGPLLADSYHCSRYNTNTGRLSVEMFEAVFAALKSRLASS